MPKGKLLVPLLALAAVFLIVEGVGYCIAIKSGGGRTESGGLKAQTANPRTLKERNRKLKDRLERLAPRGNYIVVDTASNILSLRRGKATIREMVVSAGSGNILKDPSGKRRWVFDTPRGEYTVNSKMVKPDWIRPDWAFIEEGEPIPVSSQERLQRGVLGDYALGFGNGYFIHGTLYRRLLGRNITHGCIRVGDEDLESLFRKTTIGTKVIIF